MTDTVSPLPEIQLTPEKRARMKAALWGDEPNYDSIPATPTTLHPEPTPVYTDSEETRLRKLAVILQAQLRQSRDALALSNGQIDCLQQRIATLEQDLTLAKDALADARKAAAMWAEISL